MKKYLHIIIIVAVFLVCAGVTAGIVVSRNSDKLEKEMTVTLHGETKETFSADFSGFYPGCEQEYVINLSGSNASDYFVKLDFVDETEGAGTLADYIAVIAVTDSGKNEEVRLSDLFADGTVLDLGNGAKKITLKFKMDLGEKGDNSNQGLSAKFSITLNASLKEDK